MTDVKNSIADRVREETGAHAVVVAMATADAKGENAGIQLQVSGVEGMVLNMPSLLRILADRLEQRGPAHPHGPS